MDAPPGQEPGFERLVGPLGGTVATSVASVWSARGAGFIVQFASFALLASHLGPARFGLFSFALALAEVFKIVPEFGFGPTVTRDIAQAPEREGSLLPNLLYLRLALGAASFACLTILLYASGFSHAERSAALAAGTTLVLQASSFMRPALEARLRWGRVALVDLARTLCFLGGTVLLILRGSGVLPFVWLSVGTTIGAELVIMLVSLRLVNLDWRPRKDYWSSMTRVAAPLALAGLFIALYYRLDIVILTRLKPAQDVGQYGAAYRFLDTFVVLPSLLIGVLRPVWARSFLESKEILQRRYSRALTMSMHLALPVVLIGSVAAWRIVPALPGFHRYHGSGVALSILSPGALCIFLAAVVQGVLVSGHRQNRLLRITAFGFAVNVVANVLLIPPFSYTGAAVATTITEAVVLGLSMLEVRRQFGLTWEPARAWRVAGAGSVLVVVLLATTPLPLAVQLGAGIAAYVGAAALLRVLPEADTLTFRSLLQRSAR